MKRNEDNDLKEIAKSPHLTAAYLALANRKYGPKLFKLLHTTYKVLARVGVIVLFIFPVVKRVYYV